MVVTIGDDQPALGIELERMRCPELARCGSRLSNGSEKLAGFVEHRDAANQIWSRHIGVALSHVNVATARIGYDVGRIGQRFGWISSDARFPQGHEDLAFGVELDDHASLVAFARKLGELLRARRACVGHPHISIAVDVDAVRPHEHPSAKAPDLLPRLIELVNGVGLRPETTRSGSRGTTVGRPHGLAVAVDGHTVGAAPRPCLDVQLRPIPDDTIRIGAGVDGLKLIRLRSASPLLSLNAISLQRNTDGDQQDEPGCYKT